MKACTPALIAVTLTLAACSNGPNSRYEDFGDRINTEGFGHRYEQPEGQRELVMGPGDTIAVTIARNPELSSTQTIRFEGLIQAPYVGAVEVAGLTPAQIRDKLTLLISPYIRDVLIEVVPLEIRSKNIYLFSTDQNSRLVARRLPLREDLTLVDLVALLGGLPLGVDDCHIKVMRGDPRHPHALNINLRDIIVNGYMAANIELAPNDMIWMPPTFFFALAQEINRITLPLRSLRRALRDADDLREFIEEGEFRDRRFSN